MKEQIYTNYRLQLPTEEVLGTLVVKDGTIADIQSGRRGSSEGNTFDWELKPQSPAK